MFNIIEDHYLWDPVNQVFVLLEDDPGLVDVQAARIDAGWELLTTVTDVEVNAQPGMVDAWIRSQAR